MPDTLDELRTERWCAGLRFTAARPMDSDERAALEVQVQALGLRLWIAIACAPVALIVPVLAMLLLPETLGVRWLDVAVVITLALVAVAVPAALVMRARRTWCERRGVLGDLEAGEIECFEGALEAHDTLDEEQKRLLDVRALTPSAGAPQWLEVLPQSGRVMVRTVGQMPSFVAVTIAEVAAGPSYAMRVEMPSAMAWLDGEPQARFMRRTLNHHECAEIDAHIRHLRRPGMLIAMWATWLSVWAVVFVFSPVDVATHVRTRWPLVLVQIVILGGVVMTYARALHLAGRLERDTHTGWALTLERAQVESEAVAGTTDETTEPAPGAPEGADDVPAAPGRCVEFLPHSRAVWSEQGRPARWRNLRRAA